MVRLQQSTQALNADNFGCIINRMFRLDDPPYSLMNPFMMIILTVLPKTGIISRSDILKCILGFCDKDNTEAVSAANNTEREA
ncbi:MAG: hypothetical protein GY845_18080 [Planctomycetes bacterium]|nr:hypothetical protein [Planctomycetota bacterium]